MQAMEERSSAGQKVSWRRRFWRRLTMRVMLLVYQPGDTVSDVAKRVPIFAVLGWGGFIALLYVGRIPARRFPLASADPDCVRWWLVPFGGPGGTRVQMPWPAMSAQTLKRAED